MTIPSADRHHGQHDERLDEEKHRCKGGKLRSVENRHRHHQSEGEVSTWKLDEIGQSVGGRPAGDPGECVTGNHGEKGEADRDQDELTESGGHRDSLVVGDVDHKRDQSDQAHPLEGQVPLIGGSRPPTAEDHPQTGRERDEKKQLDDEDHDRDLDIRLIIEPETESGGHEKGQGDDGQETRNGGQGER